jgi:hypothetical protein
MQINKRNSRVLYLALDIYEAIRNASTSVEIGEKAAALAAQFDRSQTKPWEAYQALAIDLSGLPDQPQKPR